MTARAKWTGRALVAVVAAVLAIDLFTVATDLDTLRPPRAGVMAPGFALPSISSAGEVEREPLALSDLRGKTVVIDFWATWCGACKDSMPTVHKIVAERKGDVVLLAVAIDGYDEPELARQLIDQLSPGAALVADQGQVADMYGVSTIPHVVVVGPGGEVIDVERSYRGTRRLASWLSQTLDRAASN